MRPVQFRELSAFAATLCCTFFGAFLIFGQTAAPPASTTWLKGTPEEKFAQIERQLRGLDVSMAEIGYRYSELLIASKQRKWDAAQYQAEKIELTLRLALERRPKRAKSSQPFLTDHVPRLLAAIKQKDGAQLDKALGRLHSECLACHAAENVPHFNDNVERIRVRAKK